MLRRTRLIFQARYSAALIRLWISMVSSRSSVMMVPRYLNDFTNDTWRPGRTSKLSGGEAELDFLPAMKRTFVFESILLPLAFSPRWTWRQTRWNCSTMSFYPRTSFSNLSHPKPNSIALDAEPTTPRVQFKSAAFRLLDQATKYLSTLSRR